MSDTVSNNASIYRKKLLGTKQKNLIKQILLPGYAIKDKEAELIDHIVKFNKPSEAFSKLDESLRLLRLEIHGFKKVSNKNAEDIINKNKKMETKLNNLENSNDFSKNLSASRNFVKEAEDFETYTSKKITKLKKQQNAINQYITDEGAENSWQIISKSIASFFLNGGANKELYKNLTESNKKRYISQIQLKEYFEKLDELEKALEVELNQIKDVEEIQRSYIVRGHSAALADLEIKKKDILSRDHWWLPLVVFLIPLILAVTIANSTYQTNISVEGEVFNQLLGSIVAIVVGAFTFATGWGYVLFGAGIFTFLATIWESQILLTGTIILIILVIIWAVIIVNWETWISAKLQETRTREINIKISNLIDDKKKLMATNEAEFKNKQTKIETLFQKDTIDLEQLSNETQKHLKATFKNLHTEKEFSNVRFREEGDTLINALSDDKKIEKNNLKRLADNILHQLSHDISLEEIQSDMGTKLNEKFNSYLQDNEDLTDVLSKQNIYIKKIIKKAEANIKSFRKIAIQLNKLNLKEAK